MTVEKFLKDYLKPSSDQLNRAFTHSLPPIEGLEKRGSFIVQAEVDDTFSTNIMTKYESDKLGIRFVEVYKNTQNRVSGLFVRLVGSMSLVKPGYPFIVLDASIRNVAQSVPEKEDIATRVAIHMPQATYEQKKLFFSGLNEQADKAGIYHEIMDSRGIVPDFWGTVWLGQEKDISLDTIRKLRDFSWYSYWDIIIQTKAKTPFDYRPIQEEMIFPTAKREHLGFASRGLSVPTEAQAAFFSVMVTGL